MSAVDGEELRELLRKANRIEVGKGDILWLRVSDTREHVPPDHIEEFFEGIKRAMATAFEAYDLPVPPIIVSDDNIDAKVISVVDLLGLIGDTADAGD